MDRNSINKIVEDRIKALEGNEFQHFCDRLLLILFPKDYTPVRSGGRNGDMKNDGYCYISRIFFQAHASRGEQISKLKSKISADLKDCLKKQRDVKEFIYITNDTLVGEVEKFIDDLRRDHPDVKIEPWGPEKIALKIMDFQTKDIEYIIDRNLSSNRPESNQYFALVENEEADYGIIEDIFDYIFKEVIAGTISENSPDEKSSYRIKRLTDKIKINFDRNFEKRVRDAYNNLWRRKELVERFVERQMEIDETRVFALIEKIQSDFCTISNVENSDYSIGNPKVFDDLGIHFVPKLKRTNPDYIANAKAIVLYFFEFCDFGKKTEDEIKKFTLRSLFPELE